MNRKQKPIDMSETIASQLAAATPTILDEERGGLGEAPDGGDGWNEGEARSALETFVANHFAGNQDYRNEEKVVKVIERVLAVDMQLPSNRKGALPQALGLVSPSDSSTRARHRAIYRLMELAEQQGDATIEERAAGVSMALKQAGTMIDEGTVKKIYQRHRPRQ